MERNDEFGGLVEAVQCKELLGTLGNSWLSINLQDQSDTSQAWSGERQLRSSFIHNDKSISIVHYLKKIYLEMGDSLTSEQYT